MSDNSNAIAQSDGTLLSEANRRESFRQQDWVNEKSDREGLRDSLSRATEHFDNPKKRPDPVDENSTIRSEAESAYDTLMNAGAAAEIERKAFEDFQRLGKVAQRTHGMGATDAFRTLLAGEKSLRENPGAALNKLIQDYGDGTYGRSVADTEIENTAGEVAAFFAKYDVPKGSEALIINALKSGAVPRTGDTEHDLLTAYRFAKKDHKRVRSVR